MLNTSSPTIMPHRATSKNTKKLIKMYAVAARLLLKIGVCRATIPLKGGDFMIKSEREFTREMRKTILRIANGQSPFHNPATDDDSEVIAECINHGYLLSKHPLENGAVLRTMDGKAHPDVNTTVIPLKGLAFLKPDRTRTYARVSLWLSIAALLVSILSNLPEIFESVRMLIDLLKSIAQTG